MKHRHKWKWIVQGYARECIKCGEKEFFGKSSMKEYQGHGTSYKEG